MEEVIEAGLAQIPADCLYRQVFDAVQRCYQQHFGDGFGYACRIPAMQKVLQAGGRVIRSENDRGILLLLDSRYYESAYAALLPEEWRPFGEDVPQAAKALWGEPS